MKPVFQGFFALIVIALIGALVASFSIDGIVKSHIQNSASKTLDTSVNVDNVSISILDGNGNIEGITIHNPDGFSDSAAVKMKKVSIKMDIYSLLTDTIVVNEVRIQQPELYFQQKASGNNFDALTKNMEGSSSGGPSIVVDHLLVEDGKVMLQTDIGGDKSAHGTFSKIEINDIGRQGNNSSKQVIKEMLRPILKRAATEAVKSGLMDKAKDAVKDLLDG